MLVVTDGFDSALEVIPTEDWFRTSVVDRTIKLTSKRVKEVVDKMSLSVVVRLTRRFWDDTHNDSYAEKM